jgi:glycosyltransferase involved in cell wall biosynthesis
LQTKPKILVFIDWFYPGFRSGGPTRSVWNLIQKLKDQFDFYVVTRNIDYCEDTPYLHIIPDQWQEVFEGLQVYYQDHKTLSASNIKKHIQKIDWDFCYINGLYSYYFSILPTHFTKRINKGKVIVCPRGMLSDGSISVKGTKKKAFVNIAQKFGLYKHVTFHATKKQEAENVKKWLGSDRSEVIPNFPSEVFEEKLSFPIKEKGYLNLIWLGRISPEKNLDFALKLLRNTRSGKINFMLYGVIYDKAYWDVCQEIINKMPSRINVEYMGVLNPEEIPRTLTQFHFFFLPTTGENFGHAILESLLSGTPVIISNTTPWTNLADLGVGWDLPLYEPRSFLKVLRDAINMEGKQYLELRKRVMRYREKILDIEPQIEGYNKLFSKE